MDPVIGREKETERLTQVLCKRRKNNACLIGDPGVGKTVVVERLAMSIVDRSAPQKLAEKKVFPNPNTNHTKIDCYLCNFPQK